MEAGPPLGRLIMPRLGNTAALKAKLEVDDLSFQASLADYAVITGKKIGDVLRDQARLLTRDLVKGTPPFQSRDSSAESFNDQRKVGLNAVERDIRKVFGSIEEIAEKNMLFGNALLTSLSSRAKNGDQNLAQLMVAAGITKTPRPAAIIDAPTVALHNQYRQSRGRVGRMSSQVYFVKRKGPLLKFIRERKGDVGKGKGGWGISAFRYGFNVPAWIGRHRSGRVEDKAYQFENPFIRVINTVSYLNQQNQSMRITDYALRDRAVALTDQVRVLMKKKYQLKPKIRLQAA